MSLGVHIKKLAWDTDYFGFSVASVELSDETRGSIECALGQLKNANVRLAYLRLKDQSSEAGRFAAQAQNIRLVEERLTFEKTVPRTALSQVDSCPIVRFAETNPSQELLTLVHKSGEHSRFAVDTHFPERLRKEMYEIWIGRLLREQHSAVFVRSIEGAIVGFVGATIDDRSKVCRLELIAVTEANRGCGIGLSLVRFIERWACENSCQSVRIFTQGANTAACALYVKGGYSIPVREFTYHIWGAQDSVVENSRRR